MTEVGVERRKNCIIVINRQVQEFFVAKNINKELGSKPDRQIARDWLSQKAQKSKETAGTTVNLHHPTFKDSTLGIGTVNGRTFNARPSSNMSQNKADNYGQEKINEFFSFSRNITHENNNLDYEDEISVPSREQETYHHNYIEDSEYFDKLTNRVDLNYIGREDDFGSPRPKSESIPTVNSWDLISYFYCIIYYLLFYTK
ncbi:hypothetical protein C1645_812791 [Glomus cerebriforme]|uniref:Uncharacterized protein n=1 Tax=Glomus cerebriforme TaxID=658196 RepID=A0A397TPH8_9GLOM|nr:hypothetical protein C1645_812791 [Glomus cerebriforme]